MQAVRDKFRLVHGAISTGLISVSNHRSRRCGWDWPLPQAFTRAQAEHLAAKCDYFIVDDSAGTTVGVYVPVTSLDGQWICKIIHISGTTSRPKGVCLTESAITATLNNLRSVMPEVQHRRYLSVVPLSENASVVAVNLSYL